LAKVYYHQRKITQAKRAMRRAIALAYIEQSKNHYIAKLSFLKSLQENN
jgi:hypothetical protein